MTVIRIEQRGGAALNDVTFREIFRKASVDENAFLVLYGLFAPRVAQDARIVRLAWTCGDADDLVQETMIRFYQKLPSLEPKSINQVFMLLIHIASGIYFDHRRKDRRRVTATPLTSQLANLSDES